MSYRWIHYVSCCWESKFFNTGVDGAHAGFALLEIRFHPQDTKLRFGSSKINNFEGDFHPQDKQLRFRVPPPKMKHFELFAACDNACNDIRTIKRATPHAHGDGWRCFRERCVPQTLCMALQLCETDHIMPISMRSRISPPGFVPGDKFI